MASAARADGAARARRRACTGVLALALAALAAAVLTCRPGASAPPQADGPSPMSGAAAASQAVVDSRPAGEARAIAEAGGTTVPPDRCVHRSMEDDGPRCGPHLPGGKLNSAAPAAPREDDEPGSHPAPRLLGAGYRATGPPAPAPDLHLLQLLRV